jgi:hypothetical protein
MLLAPAFRRTARHSVLCLIRPSLLTKFRLDIRMCTGHAINDPATAVDCAASEPPASTPPLEQSASEPARQSQKKQKIKNKEKPKKVTPPAASSKKKDKGPPPEEILHLPLSPYSTPSGTTTPSDSETQEETPFQVPIVDTHTHLLSTFATYR